MVGYSSTFFSLLRAGLWEQDVRLEAIDYKEVYRLAKEQSVVGLIAAGLEHLRGLKPEKKDVLPFMKRVLSTETRNQGMNGFIGELMTQLRDAGIYSVLVKGQGVAQCYERPLWRSAGDVDLLLDRENYLKAKAFFPEIATRIDEEDTPRLHLGMHIGPWEVELHGTMHTGISPRLNETIDAVQRDIFESGGVRNWDDGGVMVALPNPDNDVILIFTHFIQHFYVGGIGLRQICDWCRLLWTYKDVIDKDMLRKRLEAGCVFPEWQAFAALAVTFLGMPADAMPFYADTLRCHRRARRISRLILETGNFGHNKDESYRSRYSGAVQKAITFFRRLGEFLRLSTIFPSHAPRFFINYVLRRVEAI